MQHLWKSEGNDSEVFFYRVIDVTLILFFNKCYTDLLQEQHLWLVKAGSEEGQNHLFMLNQYKNIL